ncbi:TetR/AcrR family transcriptional regulator [Streptomyces sp. NPDC058442]|uniref:TetR/AcrR family transcriptional regulator n=1 Tax=Streptomyces sp. NPDC058442 TaxID=3346503 RepID=UPI00365A6E1B
MSSTTPTPSTPSGASAPQSPSAPRASLAERRKAETRMEIARAAAGLFVREGLRATRAEDIAQAAGVAPRTFYRYFAAKEEAVAPLYEAGARRWVEAVRTAPPGTPVPQALEDAVRYTLTPGVGVSEASWAWVRTLIRLAHADPSLRRVWAEACQASERALVEALASRSAADGSVGKRVTGGRLPSGNVAVDTRLRFAAAVASAAVRTATEGWAAGDDPAEGPQGPAELALANLAALRDFPWDDLTAMS